MAEKPLFERLVDRGATVIVTIILTGATWLIWETVMDFRDTKRGLEATQEVLGEQIAELSKQIAELRAGGATVPSTEATPNAALPDIKKQIYERKATKK